MLKNVIWVACAVAERAHGKEHGDAHECSKIYVLKYTECHPPDQSLASSLSTSIKDLHAY